MKAIELAKMILALPPEDQEREAEIKYWGYYETKTNEVVKPFVDEYSGKLVIGRVETIE